MKRPRNSNYAQTFGTRIFKTTLSAKEFKEKLETVIHENPKYNQCCLTQLENQQSTELSLSAAPCETRFLIDGLNLSGSIIVTHVSYDLLLPPSIVDHIGSHDLLDECDEDKKIKEEEKRIHKVVFDYRFEEQTLIFDIRESLPNPNVLEPYSDRLNIKDVKNFKKMNMLFLFLKITEKKNYLFTDSAIESAREVFFEDYNDVMIEMARTHRKVIGVLKGETSQVSSAKELEDIVIPPQIKPKYTLWRGRKLLLRRKMDILSSDRRQKINIYYRVDTINHKILIGHVEKIHLI